MLLVIDVGNTNIVLGIFKDQELVDHWRVSTDRLRTTDEYGVLIRHLFYLNGVNSEEIDAIIISSVVPPVMPTLERMCQRYFGLTPLVIGPGVKTGMDIKYDNPREVGADRIVNAVAAYEKFGGPVIIIDFGTATTFCAVDKKGTYLAGPSARASVFRRMPWYSGRQSCHVSKSSRQKKSFAAIPLKACRPVSFTASSARSTASCRGCGRNWAVRQRSSLREALPSSWLRRQMPSTSSNRC